LSWDQGNFILNTGVVIIETPPLETQNLTLLAVEVATDEGRWRKPMASSADRGKR
jgi:hypothetical protein